MAAALEIIITDQGIRELRHDGRLIVTCGSCTVKILYVPEMTDEEAERLIRKNASQP